MLKTTTRVEITITISTAIHIKNNKNFGSYIRAIFYTNCYYNVNPCGIIEKIFFEKVFFSKFSEIKVQETWALMFVIRWKLAIYLRKIYCLRKWKMDVENLNIKSRDVFRIFLHWAKCRVQTCYTNYNSKAVSSESTPTHFSG